MSVWTVALGVFLGWVAALLGVAVVIVVAGLVSAWNREPCRVCGLRFSPADLLVHEELEHQERSSHG